MKGKKIIIPVLAVTFAGTALLLKTSLVKAENLAGHQSGLIQYLASKLNIDQGTIQTAVDEYQTQEQATREQERLDSYTTYLNGLVSEGKITEDQKTAIINKQSELESARESDDNSSQTPEERRTQMETEQTELESWAESQGIDISYLRFGFGGGRRGPGGDMMHGDF